MTFYDKTGRFDEDALNASVEAYQREQLKQAELRETLQAREAVRKDETLREREKEAVKQRRLDDDEKRARLAREDKDLADRAKATRNKDKAAKGREKQPPPGRDEPAVSWMADGYAQPKGVEVFDALDSDRALEAAFEKSGFHRAGRRDEVAMAEQRRLLKYGAQAERSGYAEPHRGDEGPQTGSDGPERRPTGPQRDGGPADGMGSRKAREVPDFQAVEKESREASERGDRLR